MYIYNHVKTYIYICVYMVYIGYAGVFFLLIRVIFVHIKLYVRMGIEKEVAECELLFDLSTGAIVWVMGDA